jgi:hypothetical protein
MNHEDLPDHEHWDCPTCLRPMPPEHDHRCSTCDMFASQHISVTAMCKILREMSGREASLIVENQRLKEKIQSLRL